METAHTALARSLEERIEALAEAYIADPSRGHDEGYWPERGLVRSRCDRAAWLYGIAKRDLSEWRWRVMQGIECAAELVISGPRATRPSGRRG